MKILSALIKRNTKLFFKDKGLFFTSLITPMILLVLYVSFLGNVYESSFLSTLPQGFVIDQELVDGYVAAQLISSILAVSAVTVAFCSNMLMVQDRANGSFSDLAITPARRELFAVGYYAASLISTLIICLIASAVCLIYSAIVGFYMSFVDVLLMLCDVIMLVMFGTAISSVINFFLKTQGQISAVGSIVSSCYGFVCGAYMPISQFSEGLRNVVSCLPGTYGTSLLRNHCMRGVIAKMEVAGVPVEAIDGLRDAVDINLYFFGERVSTGVMYAVLLSAIALFVAAYVIQNVLRGKRTA